jgi:hypothetical protein
MPGTHSATGQGWLDEHQAALGKAGIDYSVLGTTMFIKKKDRLPAEPRSTSSNDSQDRAISPRNRPPASSHNIQIMCAQRSHKVCAPSAP